MVKSTVSPLLDVNIDELGNNLYHITIGPLHAPTGTRMVKEPNGKLPDYPHTDLTYQEAKIFAVQWQEWIDKQNKDKAQWKKKKKGRRK